MSLSRLRQQKLDTMFGVLDVDGDGRIDGADFARRVRAFARLRGWREDSAPYARNLDVAMEEWENLRQTADQDDDGRVTLEEFRWFGATYLDDRDAVRAFSRGDVQLLFDAMDGDGDGAVTLEEYRAYLEVCGVERSAADAFFAHADLDENGRLTRAEMSHAMEEFLLSENPDAAGNFLFGPLAAPPQA